MLYSAMPEVNFDPIDFLGLVSLNQSQKEKLRPRILEDMANFIITQFVGNLSDDQLTTLEAKLPDLQDYQLVMDVIKELKSDFETEKLGYLENYREQFQLQNFIDCLT